jgi:hypothetical protein
VHGFAILRSGEALSVVASGPGGKVQTSPAVFDDVSKQYIGSFASLTLSGSYVVELVSVLGRAIKASFTIACAQGYVASGEGECQPRRSLCETATLNLPAGGLVVQGVLVVSNLVSARSVELMPVSTATSFDVSDGLATVRFATPGPFLVRVTDADFRQCSLSQQLQVGCPAGFLDDGSGRCVCPVGLENKDGKCAPVQQEVDLCQLASVSSSATLTRLVSGDIVTRPGTQLGISFETGISIIGFETLLVPLQGTERRPITETLWLNRSGLFAVKLKKENSKQECSLIPRLDVRCGEGEQEVDGQCQPRDTCRSSDGFWEDITASAVKCRKRPLMAVKAASDKLQIVLRKRSSAPDIDAAVEVRLVSGDADAAAVVEWTASSSSDWLVLERSFGMVSSANPVATIHVIVRGSGQSDTAASGPLESLIRVRSSMRGRADLFENGTSRLELVVAVTIEADVYLGQADVRLQTKGGEDVTSGSKVIIGDTLTVTAIAFDYERLPIGRATLRILAELSSVASNHTALVQPLDGNSYRAELPSTWIDTPGEYTLRLGSVEIRFTVTKTNQSLYVAAAIGAVLHSACHSGPFIPSPGIHRNARCAA